MKELDYVKMFHHMHPGFFERENIRGIAPEDVYEEMILWLDGFSPDAVKIDVPAGITFGEYHGNLEALLNAVRQVDEGWAAIYQNHQRVFCAFDGGRIASFCIIEDMTSYDSLKIGGPGCVGTLPEYRKKGIGLRMVQLATDILKKECYDLSYIHFTGVAGWYAKLGYVPILKWNSGGIL
ncbi:MAG: GNAT family N-acetyltransferase [Clostridia bacterium]|nr:GNAT family N-acetyltransferase [Clostridia bacterium]